jgi:hypothetical protein
VHSDALAYQGVLADVATWTGIATLGLMALSRPLFRASWGAAAVATPAALLVSGTYSAHLCARGILYD